ncbi:hypothetical protein EQG68_04625 [Flavobacterium piscinae]|uniref:DUF6705 domain-containing protein n=1 Tax=Flavobacterium piscinae TaxID=2506424 RepID=A0A4Q1KTL8_9FLAO|nr:DUF6705 family protein [Flavobacterium piscinae]RXR33518.1 hypothetical protein EQG68_04625 [Flavobacterium piscinae]
MKKIILGIILLFNFSLVAQNPILDIHTADFANIENAYYKDIDNFYNQFVGTWIYTDSVKIIRFKFVKKEMFYRQSIKSCYVDYLVGEMQYVENGVEKINSLINLNINHSEIYNYNLYSYGKTNKDWYPKCLECPDTIERLPMSYNEPTNDDAGLEAAFVMHRADENGVEKIKIQYIETIGAYGIKPDGSPSITTNFTIPYGDYILIKEN